MSIKLIPWCFKWKSKEKSTKHTLEFKKTEFFLLRLSKMHMEGAEATMEVRLRREHHRILTMVEERDATVINQANSVSIVIRPDMLKKLASSSRGILSGTSSSRG